jgi:hypothetical protein
MWRTSPDPGRSTAALPSTRPKMPNSPRWPMRSPRWTRTFSPSRRSVTPPPCRTWRTSSPATPMWPPRTRTAAASASDICRSLSSLVCGRSRPSRPRCARSRLTTPPPPRVRWVVPRSSPASPLRRRRRRPGHLPPQVEAAHLSRWFVQHPRRGSARPLQRLRPLPPRRRSRHCRDTATQLLAGQGQQRAVVMLGDLNDGPDAATTQILPGPPGSEIGTGGYEAPDQGDGARLWNLSPRIQPRRTLQPHLPRSPRTDRPHPR